MDALGRVNTKMQLIKKRSLWWKMMRLFIVGLLSTAIVSMLAYLVSQEYLDINVAEASFWPVVFWYGGLSILMMLGLFALWAWLAYEYKKYTPKEDLNPLAEFIISTAWLSSLMVFVIGVLAVILALKLLEFIPFIELNLNIFTGEDMLDVFMAYIASLVANQGINFAVWQFERKVSEPPCVKVIGGIG